MGGSDRGKTLIRVLLAEDTNMVRGALVALLSLEPDLEVVAEVANGNFIEPAALDSNRTWQCWTSIYPGWTDSALRSDCGRCCPVAELSC